MKSCEQSPHSSAHSTDEKSSCMISEKANSDMHRPNCCCDYPNSVGLGGGKNYDNNTFHFIPVFKCVRATMPCFLTYKSTLERKNRQSSLGMTLSMLLCTQGAAEARAGRAAFHRTRAAGCSAPEVAKLAQDPPCTGRGLIAQSFLGPGSWGADLHISQPLPEEEMRKLVIYCLSCD